MKITFEDIKNNIKPDEILLVIDSMMGQDAINVITGFNDKLPLTGVILTKLDGDTRGGVALSVRHLTNVPIKFMGTSEKLDGLDFFDPERMAGRILGMGDVLSLIEKAEIALDEKKAAKLEENLRKNKFDLEDLLDQFEQINRMGSMKDILSMLPGINKKVKDVDVDDRQLDRMRAIIQSMTKKERANHLIIGPSRRKRIAAGSGTTVADVNKLIKQFEGTRKMMKSVIGANMGNMMKGAMKRRR